MVVFVDTSALYALLDSHDENHRKAVAVWQGWRQRPITPLSTNYVVLEAHTLVQRRLGMAAVQDFQDVLIPLLQIHWIAEEMHQRGVASLLAANRRLLSLVDCTSFVVMRQLGIERAFAFDRHFTEQGFIVLPEEN